MFTVSMFFVPWGDPDGQIECERESEELSAIPTYGVSMVEAAELEKELLPLDTTFTVLRVVKQDGELIETETETMSTGRSREDALVRETLYSVQKMLHVIDSVADAFTKLKE